MTNEVKIRLYCQGIGDCMLIDLPRDDGGRFHLLVDCGVHSLTKGGSERMAAVVKDLKQRTGGRIDAIAGTHEHWDHLSAFLTEADAWDGFEVGEVWFSWAENPDDADAQRLDRFRADATAAVSGLRAELGITGEKGEAHGAPFGVHAMAAAAVDSLSGFVFGAKGERVRSAREALRALVPASRVRYLKPGGPAPMKGVSAATAWVLGPPRDDAKLKLHDNPGNEYRLMMGPSRGFAAVDGAIRVREGTLTVSDDPSSPFDGSQGQRFSSLFETAGDRWDGWDALDPVTRQHLWDCYFDGSENEGSLAARRRIDGAWMGAAVNFALQMDRNTNNSSLVLALEIGEGGDVLLLAADAQGGAWASFADLTLKDGDREVTAGALIARTAFYKVGHHGSINATARTALEVMDPARLVAFVPVDEAVARDRCRWDNFPAAKLTRRLQEQTSGRLIRADDDWLNEPGGRPPFEGKLGTALTDISHGRTKGAGVPWVELSFGG
jgi:hypothetical protein